MSTNTNKNLVANEHNILYIPLWKAERKNKISPMHKYASKIFVSELLNRSNFFFLLQLEGVWIRIESNGGKKKSESRIVSIHKQLCIIVSLVKIAWSTLKESLSVWPKFNNLKNWVSHNYNSFTTTDICRNSQGMGSRVVRFIDIIYVKMSNKNK